MTLAAALLVGALLVLWLAPTGLIAAIRLRVEPQAALTAWLMLVISTFLTLALAVVVTLLPGHGPAVQLVAMLQHGWSALDHSAIPPLDAIAGLTGLIVLTLLSVRVAHAVVRRLLRQRDTYRHHITALRGIARTEPGRYPLMWLEHPEPLAYSVAGPGRARPVIVATRGLTDRLAAPDAAAVIDHERAHLRGQHHLLVVLADALAAALPRLAMMSRSPDLIRTLVELAADRAAARKHGSPALHHALEAMSRTEIPGHSLAMARDSVSIRLDWLESAEPTGPTRQLAAAGLAGLTATMLPIAIGMGLLALTGLAACIVIAFV